MRVRGRTTSRYGKVDADGQAANAPETIACLLGNTGVQAGRVHALGRPVTVLGSDPTADICIDDDSIAPRHARILVEADGLWVEDLGSRTGTFVDSQQILRARLHDHAALALGAVDFTFLADINELSLAAPAALVPYTHLSQEQTQGRPWPESDIPRPAYAEVSIPPGASVQQPTASFVEFVTKIAHAYRFLRRYAIFLLVCTMVGVAGATASMVYLPPAPRFRCEIKLDPQIKINPVERRQADGASGVHYFDAAVNTLPSAKLVRSTLEKMGINNPPDGLVTTLAWRIGVEPLGNNLYAVTYQESRQRDTPQGALKFLEVHVNNYVNSEIDKTLKVVAAEAEFLRGQKINVETELAELNQRITRFRQNNSDALPEQASGTLQSRFEMEARLGSLQAELRRVEGELLATRKQLHSESALASSRQQETQRYRDGIADVNRKLSEARAQGLADEHPTVRALLQERRHLEALITEQTQTRSTQFERQANPTHQQQVQRIMLLEAQRSALEGELRDIKRGLARTRAIVGEMPRVETTLQELMHQQAVTQRLADQLFERLRTTELQLELERVAAASRFEVVSPPAQENTSRKKTLLARLAIGIAAALALAAVVIAILEGRTALRTTGA